MPSATDLDVWDTSVRQICGDFFTVAPTETPFIGHIQLTDLGGLGVAHIETNAQRVKHRLSDSRNDQYCFLIMQIQGIMGFTTSAGETLQLQPGEAALVDSAVEFDMFPQGLIRQISVHLPRQLVSRSLCRSRICSKVPRDNLSGQLIHGLLQQLCFDNAPFHTAAPDACALQATLSSLLKAALEQERVVESEESLRQVAERLILQHLHDHRLTPESLAQKMRISKRKLYRLFEADGDSVARHIQNLRLKRCTMDLSNPGQSHQSITDIAFRWGFSDVSQFSRAFKRMTGVSPRTFRQQYLASH